MKTLDKEKRRPDQLHKLFIRNTDLIEKFGTTYALNNQVDVIRKLAPVVSEQDIKIFSGNAVKILSECNPLLDVSKSERLQMQLYELDKMTYSPEVRRGTTITLAAIVNHLEWFSSCDSNTMRTAVNKALREIFKNANNWKWWGSVGELLPTRAEANPTLFLESVEGLLKGDGQIIRQMMEQASDQWIGNSDPLLYIRNSLSILAWEPQFFARSLHCLYDMAGYDIDVNGHNRSIDSMVGILLPLHPHTYETVKRRHKILENLLLSSDDNALMLFRELLPRVTSIASMGRKPEWIHASSNEQFIDLNSDYEFYAEHYVKLALRAADTTLAAIKDIGRSEHTSELQSRI